MARERAEHQGGKARGWILGAVGVLGLIPVLVLTGFLLAHFREADEAVRSAVRALPLAYIALMGWGVLRVVLKTRVVEGRRRPATPTQLVSGYLFGSLLLLLALTVTIAVQGRYDPHMFQHPIATWVILGAMAFGGWFTVVYYRRLDEAALEAHKFAWMWGAQSGLFFVTCAALLLYVRGDESGSLTDGVFLALIAATIGYALAWGFWWLRKR